MRVLALAIACTFLMSCGEDTSHQAKSDFLAACNEGFETLTSEQRGEGCLCFIDRLENTLSEDDWQLFLQGKMIEVARRRAGFDTSSFRQRTIIEEEAFGSSPEIREQIIQRIKIARSRAIQFCFSEYRRGFHR